MAEGSQMEAIWKVTVRDLAGNITHEEEHHNVIVNEGRHDALGDLFVSSFTRELFPYLCVGSFNPTAGVSDIGLAAEITNATSPAGSETQRLLCTNTSNATLSASDITADSSVSPYQEKIILQAIFGTGDNNGTTFFESCLNDTQAFPTIQVSSNNPAAGSNVVIDISNTTGFVATNTIIVSGTTSGGSKQEECVIGSVSSGVSVTVNTLANTYTAPVTLTVPSGRSFNHFVFASSIAKNSSNSVTFQVTIRT